jgi:hypothetical protein
VPYRNCLQIALEDLASLEAILSLKGDPAIDSASLNTDHLLVAVLGLEVGNGLGTLPPRVPDDGVLHVVSDDIQTGLIVDKDRGCVLREGLVDTVDGAFDAELVALGVVLGGVEDLVCVSDAGQAGDLDLGNVLSRYVSTISMRSGKVKKRIQGWQSRCGRESGSQKACRPGCGRSA